MVRRLFNLLAALSLLLAVANVALWVVSYWRVEIFGIVWQSWPNDLVYRQGILDLRMADGYWFICHDISDAAVMKPQDLAGWEAYKAWRSERPPKWLWRYARLDLTTKTTGQTTMLLEPNKIGLGYKHYLASDNQATRHTRVWGMSAVWSIAALLIMPVLRWRNARRLRVWEREGRCLSCGYDLRATPDRCPECGSIPDGLKA